MTKEELYDYLANIETEYGINSTDLAELLNIFFNSNVCIPKGDNRHQSAEVLHEWVEDTNNKIQYKVNCDNWNDFVLVPDYFDYKLRIKPQDPVYEWQWLVYNGTGYIISDNGRFMTFEETCDGMIPIKETKRERK